MKQVLRKGDLPKMANDMGQGAGPYKLGTSQGDLRQSIAILERQQFRSPSPARAARIAELKKRFKATGGNYKGGVSAPNVKGKLKAGVADPWGLIDVNGGGSGGDSWGSSKAAAEYETGVRAAESQKAYERELELMRLQQQYDAEQKRKQMEEERKAKLEALKQERLQIFTSLLGNDPVRAVLYALGIGGETTGLPTEQFKALAPMTGAKEKKKETETSLKSVADKYGAAAGNITLGNKGVEGMSSPEQYARAVAQGDENTLKLLTSAFGVGSSNMGGISGTELKRRADEVTPMGVLGY